MTRLPQRIVCLTAESAEILYALGAQDRLVGVSGYTVRPPEARHKPRVGGYTSIDLDRVDALDPDFIIAYSDLQADITAALAKRGRTILHLNQRRLEEIFAAIALIGAVVDRSDAAADLIDRLREECRVMSAAADRLARRPRVYFEEWDEPLISGIGWVSEAVACAGGIDVFAELSASSSAAGRLVRPDDVVQRNPEIIFASWCGKKVRAERLIARPGWDRINAVRHGRIHEIKSADILQPGPSVLTGMRRMADAIADWSRTLEPEACPA